jgi:hypothetical protein
MLNAAINSPEAKQLWATPGWLPEEIGIIVDPQGHFYCYEGSDLKLHIERKIHPITVYSLIGLAADIDSGQHQKSHLVSLINGMSSSLLSISFNLSPQSRILNRQHPPIANGTFLTTS